MSLQLEPIAPAPVDPVLEEENHQRVLELTPRAPDALSTLMTFLGDPSWRVRKAALLAIERFRQEPRLVDSLIGGLGSQDNAGLRNICAEALVSLGEGAVPQLSEALYTADLDQRKFVVEVLGFISTPAAHDALFKALDQADSNVKSAVVDALGQLGGARVIEELTRRLTESQDDLQYTAYLLDALARCHAQLSYKELLPHLEQRQLARFVYPLLGLCQDTAALKPLVHGIAVGSRGMRRMALPALSRLWRALGSALDGELKDLVRAEDAMQAALTQALEDEDPVAEAAVRLLGLCRAEALAPQVLRICAARGMAHIGIDSMTRLGSSVIAPLMTALDGADVQTQLLFLDVVESVGDVTAMPALLDLAQSAHVHIAAAAVRAVGKLADAAVVESLMRLVRQRDEAEMSRQTVFALVSIGQRHTDVVATHMRRALEVGDVEPAWLSVLGSLRRPQDVDMLVAACKHLNHEVRRAAVEAAQNYGSRMSEATLLHALRDDHPRVRVAAARSLSAYGSDASVQALLASMQDIDPWVVAEAARSLGTVGGRRAAQALHQAAGSTIAPIAIAALQGLAHIETDGLEITVRKAMRHVEAEVVCEALSVASRLDRKFALEVLSEGLQHRAWDVRWAASELVMALRLPAPASLVHDCWERETEPLVREKLERLRAALGGFK